MRATITITPATEHPVTLDEVKSHLKLDGTSEDAYLGIAIATSTEAAQSYTQRQFMQATFELQVSEWSSCIVLEKAPLVNVESIKYIDPEGNEQTLDPAAYEVCKTKVPGFIRFLVSLPAIADKLDAIKIRYTAGYGALGDDASTQRASTPSAIKSACLLQIGHYYENRQDEVAGTSIARFEKNSEWLLHPYRLYL